MSEEDIKKSEDPTHSPDAMVQADGVELTDRISDEITMGAEGAGPASSPSEEEAEAAAILEEEKVKDEIEIQIDLLKDPDWAVRREAVVTLGEMGDERCVEPLIKALRDGDHQVRDAAIEAVAMVGSPAVEYLIRMLRDWDTRKFVIMAMGKVKDERVLDPLIAQLRNDEFMEYATDALVELGEPAIEHLIAALDDKDENTRKQAIIALGRIKAESAVDALIEKLQDKDWFTRLSAAAALEKIGDQRGREAIKPLLKDPDLVVRMRVERILKAWKKETANA
jgi:HEAT repeat protein